MVGPAAAFFAINDIGLNSREVGEMLSAQAGMQVLSGWGCGRLSDALGRRVLILACFACGCVGITLLSLASTRVELWIATLIVGLQAGFYPISDSYILDSVPVDDRPAYTGMYGAAFGVTFTFGNAVGALLLYLGLDRRYLFMLAAAVSASAIAYGYLRLQESFASTKRRPVLADGGGGAADWEAVGSGLLCVWLCNFCYGLSDGFMTMYPFLIQDLFGWRDEHFAMAMGVVGMCAGVVMLFAFPVLAKRFGSPVTLGLGCFCGAVSYALFPRQAAVHMVGLAFFMLAVALFNPSVPVVVGLFASDRHFGFASGVGGAARSGAGAISPMVAGRLYEHLGPDHMFAGSFCFMGGVLAAVGVFFSPVRKDEETKPLV
jgi:MFS family permease